MIRHLFLIVIVGVFATNLVEAQTHNEQHQTSNAPFLKPAEAVAKMAIPAGFNVSVFAAEPDIAEPIAFCFDDRGRLWVVENFNYRTRGEHTDDHVTRIQILDDTDSDGVFDQKKTFTDKLTFTSGIALGFGGVYVGSPPNLSFIPDADGDDVPDGPPQPILDGWGINDRHETLNSFNWGPDGWLYGCHGVFTESMVGKVGADQSERQFIDGGIWRLHPTTQRFEIFARGLSNPWGFDFDDHGQSFATCCVIPHLFHIVQGGVYDKQSKPHVNPYIYDDIKTIRDHTHLSAHGGARFYLADAFPPEYHNRLFMCNIHEHAVLTDVMVPNGSSFIGQHGDDFMPTNDLAWVGFSVEMGPEGGVYILDWHDTDVCGNAINFPNSGRVYRIMPNGTKPIVRPNLRELSDEQLVDLQLHRNDWYVRQARLLLHTRFAQGKLNTTVVHKKLNQLLESVESSGKRLRALWAMHVTGALDEPVLLNLLSHDDQYVRAWSIQLLCDGSQIDAFRDAPQMADEEAISERALIRFAELAKDDPSPVVRLYLAAAIQRLSYESRWPILEQLVRHGEDVDDPNLSRLLWFGLEPMVIHAPQRALDLVVAGNLSMLQEFVARRLAGESVNLTREPDGSLEMSDVIKRVAPGFAVADIGEGGMVEHAEFRNRPAMQTHPKDRQNPCRLSKTVEVPTNQITHLKLTVSHHPHGDWQLRVIVDGERLMEKLVNAESVTNEWLEVSVDLTKYAGQRIELSVENGANDWHNEWAYWNEVKIISE